MILQIFLVAFRLYFLFFVSISLCRCLILCCDLFSILMVFPSISFLPSWHSKHPYPLLLPIGRGVFFASSLVHRLSSFQCDTMHTKSHTHTKRDTNQKWKERNVKIRQNPCKQTYLWYYIDTKVWVSSEIWLGSCAIIQSCRRPHCFFMLLFPKNWCLQKLSSILFVFENHLRERER